MPTIKEHQAQIKALVEEHEAQVASLVAQHEKEIAAMQKEEEKEEPPMDPQTVWVTAEDGERFLMMNEDAVKQVEALLERTGDVLEELQNVA